MSAGALLLSAASAALPRSQRCRERGLLEAAARGELHLNVAAFDGAVLSLGAHHPRLSAEEVSACPPAADDETPRVWRRATGGRAIAAGRGFLLATLALPHRAALGAAAGGGLRPEQVMNRAVRGLLTALRKLGVDATYPGLDAVTVARRAIAFSSFVEVPGGATLFEAVIAVDQSFAQTPSLLDRLDPQGAVASNLVAAADAITLAEVAGAQAEAWSDPRSAAPLLGAGYAEAFDLEVLELDPEVVDQIAAEPPADSDRATPSAGARTALRAGLLGPVTAWAQTEGGRIARCGLGGDLIAPEGCIDSLCAALVGCAPARGEIAKRLAEVLDGARGYVLGIRPDALCELMLAAASGESRGAR